MDRKSSMPYFWLVAALIFFGTVHTPGVAEPLIQPTDTMPYPGGIEGMPSAQDYPALDPDHIRSLKKQAKALTITQMRQIHTRPSPVRGAVRKPLTCPDILSGVISIPPDPDVNLVCLACYTHCIMQLSLIEYLDNLKSHGKLTPEIEQQCKEDFVTLQPLVSSFLDGCATAYWAFKDSDFRSKLDMMQQEMQEKLLDNDLVN